MIISTPSTSMLNDRTIHEELENTLNSNIISTPSTSMLDDITSYEEEKEIDHNRSFRASTPVNNIHINSNKEEISIKNIEKNKDGEECATINSTNNIR